MADINIALSVESQAPRVNQPPAYAKRDLGEKLIVVDRNPPGGTDQVCFILEPIIVDTMGEAEPRPLVINLKNRDQSQGNRFTG